MSNGEIVRLKVESILCVCGWYLSETELGGEYVNVAVLWPLQLMEDGYWRGSRRGWVWLKTRKAGKSFKWLRSRGFRRVSSSLLATSVWHARSCRRSLPVSQVSALRCSLLSQCVFYGTEDKGQKMAVLRAAAIHAQENKEVARKRQKLLPGGTRSMKKEAAKKVCDSVEETLTYMDFPSEYWQKIRTQQRH